MKQKTTFFLFFSRKSFWRQEWWFWIWLTLKMKVKIYLHTTLELKHGKNMTTLPTKLVSVPFLQKMDCGLYIALAIMIKTNKLIDSIWLRMVNDSNCTNNSCRELFILGDRCVFYFRYKSFSHTRNGIATFTSEIANWKHNSCQK